jgi:hypothetical protein
VNTVTLTQVELATAIVTATIPCLRPFMTATYTTWGGRVDTVSGSGYHKRAYAFGRDGSTPSQGTAVKAFFSRRTDRSQNNTGTEQSQDIALGAMPTSNTHRREDSQGWKEITSNTSLDDGHKSDRHPSNLTQEVGSEYINNSRQIPVQEDQQSASSQDSQKMIIRRDLEWSVRYEHRRSINGEETEVHEEYNRHFER